MAVKEYQGTPNRPGRKGYVTKVFTGPDILKARGTLDGQARESAAKHAAERATYKNRVRNRLGQTRLVSDQAAQQIEVMQRAEKSLYPKGPPASRVTVSVGAIIRNGRVIRDGEE